MDALERSRRPVRRQVNKLFDEVIAECGKPEPDLVLLRRSMELLVEDYGALLAINHRIQEQMQAGNVEDAAIDAEYDECSAMRRKFMEVRDLADSKLVPPGGRVSPVPSEAGSGSVRGHKASYKLPKIRIPQFSGEYKDWIGWWSQFSKIHEDNDLDETDKFTYLKQSMKDNTRAKSLIDGYPLSAVNYPIAVQELKERFGKEEILIDVYIRDLLSMIIQASDSKERTDLTTLYDKLQTSLRALDTLGNIDKSHFLFPMLESCLPVSVLRAWQRSPMNSTDPDKSKLDQILEFLKSEVEGDARIALAKQSHKTPEVKKPEKANNFSWKGKKPAKASDLPTAMGLVSLDSRERKELCIFCDKQHNSEKCFEAQRMSIEQKNEVLRRRGACFKCLKRGHLARDCPKRGESSHNSSLVSVPERKTDSFRAVPPPTVFQVPAFPGYQPQSANTTLPSGNQVVNMANLMSAPDVLLPTFMVGVCGQDGKVRRIRAALDTMSAHSYLTKRVLEVLKIPHKGTTLFTHAVFGGGTHRIFHKIYTIRLYALNGTFSCSTDVYDQEQISSGIPGVPSARVLDELRLHGVYLSDKCQDLKEVELLIGGDLAGKILTGRQIPLSLGPTGMETRFGWTVVGKVTDQRSDSYVVHSMVNFHSPASMWELEAIAINDPAQKLSKAEEDALTMEHFRKTVSRNEDGRYQVQLPWVNGQSELPGNLHIAKRRLESATKKLEIQDMTKEYDAIFQEWEALGVIEEISPDAVKERCHYLPHRPVIKLESSTTKIRPVFDASCKSRTAYGTDTLSLNDCLLKGPNLLEHIPNILMRFREDKVAATADIRKAFLMIDVNPEDRKFLRFLWWKDRENNILKTYQHCRVVFGVNCSPFLLSAVISYHLENSVDATNEECIKKLRSCLYVDNVAASFSSTADYEEFRTKSVQILEDAKFDLRLWESNCDIEFENPITGVLGVKWDRKEDVLFCDSSIENMELGKITKKTILSALARIFDPIGMLAPVVLVPKRLLQECWKERLAWDEEVSEIVKDQFLSWMSQMRFITKARIPRFIGIPTTDSSVHIFCDASETGYAAVAYLRLVEKEQVLIKFLMCRARVAPLEKTTINRLELISCEIATRLGETIKQAFGWLDTPFVYWTDSTTAKAWIVRDKDWGTFVGNRVRKIRAVTRAEDWNHVPGIMNPADLPSRGSLLNELVDSTWWMGPAWLAADPSEWPRTTENIDESLISRETKKTVISTVAVNVKEPWYSSKRCRFSTFSSIVKVVGWVMRFAHNCQARKAKKTPASGALKPEELETAEKRIFFLMQKEENFQTNSFPFRVMKDDDGLLRVETKLTYRQDEEDFRFPVLIPGKHYLTVLLIQEEHKKNNHAGTQFLLATLREKVWVTGARHAMKKVVRDCQRCKRYTAKRLEPITAPLPPNRVQDASPFDVTGIDYAGPLYLKSGKKVWICLFTCAVYRAVHLELVGSLSTEAFLMSLRKFIARRGRPKVIYSDNGTNFVGASRLLRQVDWEKVTKESACEKVKWIFSPPSAPWWGGWWERLVRSMKELLVRVLGKRVLQREEFEAILCDVEATLNGRPLTYVFDEDILVPLTPSLFLHGPKQNSIPDLDMIDSEFLRGRHKFRQTLMENLRQRFRREYLGQLLQRKKERGCSTLKIGDVVLIGTDNHKRVMWPVGVIEDVMEGRDGIVRVAKIRTNTGSYIRPLQRLYPLEIRNAEEELKESTRNVVKTRKGRVVKPVQRYGWN